MDDARAAPPVPATFWQYVRSLGPGLIVALTIIANAAAVVVLPVLCGALWYLTARATFIGEAWRNKWWENALLAGLFVLSLWGASQSVKAIAAAV